MIHGLDAYVGRQVSVGVRGCGFFHGRLLASDEELTSLAALEGDQLILIRTASIRLLEAQPPDDASTLPRPSSAPHDEGAS